MRILLRRLDRLHQGVPDLMHDALQKAFENGRVLVALAADRRRVAQALRDACNGQHDIIFCLQNGRKLLSFW